jgi:hypothetical protein
MLSIVTSSLGFFLQKYNFKIFDKKNGQEVVKWKETKCFFKFLDQCHIFYSHNLGTFVEFLH